MSERGGFSCAFKECKSTSNSKRGSKETMFRFPKDKERSKLWIEACNRKDLEQKTPLQLYNNYKVCKLHFKNSMFLNFEKTRLQPHAIPCRVVTNEEACSFPSATSEKDNINPDNSYDCQLNEEGSSSRMSPLENCEHTIDNEEPSTSSNTRSVQTPLSLTSMTPRESKMYQRMRAYKREIDDLRAELQELKKAKRTDDIESLDDLLDKWFPRKTADFIKMQARLFQKQPTVNKMICNY